MFTLVSGDRNPKISICKFFVDDAIGRGRHIGLPSTPGQPRRDCPYTPPCINRKFTGGIFAWRLVVQGKLALIREGLDKSSKTKILKPIA
ncbi:MAG: hypothetical protein HC865_03650 [Cyanobacteria bacterium RU_5_0]|nr:hypothetical protein [Cyanobacteria bacterium RU_5_0]